MLEKTLTANNKVRADIEYPIVAGVDKNNVPQLLRVDDNGNLATNLAGFKLPDFDEIDLSYFGSTNNPQTVTYKVLGVTVAVLTLAYVGGTPLTDDARLASVTRTA